MIEARDITVKIAGKTLLERVSLEVKTGELLAVIGANGAGKSTLLKVLAGDLKANSGQVLLENQVLQSWNPLEVARRRAVLPQEGNLEFPFTALEVALMGRAPHVIGTERPHDYAIARKALEMTETAHLEHRLYPTLSGGERQRVQLARVLTQIWEAKDNQNRYLLLDEPTSSLDVSHQHETLRVAKTLTKQGVGVLAVLHDLNLAAQYADRIVVMKNASVIAAGQAKDMLTPEIIFEAFNILVMVQKHPCLECPLIIPIPQNHTPRAIQDRPRESSL